MEPVVPGPTIKYQQSILALSYLRRYFHKTKENNSNFNIYWTTLDSLSPHRISANRQIFTNVFFFKMY